MRAIVDFPVFMTARGGRIERNGVRRRLAALKYFPALTPNGFPSNWRLCGDFENSCPIPKL